MPGAKLVVFDIDDTLLSTEKKVLPSTMHSIKRLQRSGIHVAIATGRNLALAKRVIHTTGIKNYIVCNGSAAFANERQFHQQTIARETIEKLVTAADKLKIDLIFESLDGLHSHSRMPQPETVSALKSFHIAAPAANPNFYQTNSVYQAMMFFDKPRFTQIPQAPDVDFVRFDPLGVDIVPHSGSKAKTVALLAKKLQVPAENVVAFGDNQNDREMLQSAGIGIAMGNAQPDIKAVADMTTTDCNHDGIANGLRTIGWL